MQSVQIRLDLLRHGEPDGGLIYRGLRDDALTDEGWRQMERSTGSAYDWDLIVTSPLSRCLKFAAQLGSSLGAEVHVEEGLKEMSFGHWEGKNWQEVAAEYPEESAAFWRDPDRHPPPGGESLTDFRSRIRHAHSVICSKYSAGKILYVTHGGVIRILMQELLGFPNHSLMRLQVPWASITRIVVGKNGLSGGELVFHNGSL